MKHALPPILCFVFAWSLFASCAAPLQPLSVDSMNVVEPLPAPAPEKPVDPAAESPVTVLPQAPEQKPAPAVNPEDIHNRSLVIDTHNDTMTLVLNGSSWLPENDPGLGLPNAQLDLPKMRAGGLNAAFFAAYTNAYAADYAQGAGERANSRILSLLNALYWVESKNPHTFGIAKTPQEIAALHNAGKLAGVPAIEGAYSLTGDNAPELLRQYKDLGVACIALCWNTSNALGEGINGLYIDNNPSSGGLTALGAEVVKEMNRLGIAVDVSHMNEATLRGVTGISRAPILASHSNAWGVFNHARNLKDEQMLAIAASGGVVQMNFYTGFLGPAGRQDVKALVDHIDYAVKLIGVDHVGLGSDFDGGAMPADLPDASYYYRITEELYERGYLREDIEKILGQNTLRAMRAIEEMAEIPPRGGEALDIRADFDMGAIFNERAPLFTAAVWGNQIDITGFYAVLDGITYTPEYDSASGRLSFKPAQPLQEAFHVITFAGQNTFGQETRETKIICIDDNR